MVQQRISRRNYDYLKNQLDQMVKNGKMTEEQAQNEIAKYVPKEPISSEKILLGIGAIFIGIGILFLIQYIWENGTEWILFSLAVATCLGTSIGGFFIEKKSPLTSKAFYYISTLFLGAVIFLFGDLLEMTNAPLGFVLWALGALIFSYFTRDQWLLGSAVLLALIGITSGQAMYTSSLIALLVLSGIYWLNETQQSSKPFFYVSSVVLIALTTYNLSFNFFGTPLYGLLFVFSLAVFMWVYPRINMGYIEINKWLGPVFVALTGLPLSVKETWSTNEFFIIVDPFITSIIFLGVFVLICLLFLPSTQIQSLVLLGVMSLRVFAEYGRYPEVRILFFIVLGIVMIVLGFLYEQNRRKSK